MQIFPKEKKEVFVSDGTFCRPCEVPTPRDEASHLRTIACLQILTPLGNCGLSFASALGVIQRCLLLGSSFTFCQAFLLPGIEGSLPHFLPSFHYSARALDSISFCSFLFLPSVSVLSADAPLTRVSSLVCGVSLFLPSFSPSRQLPLSLYSLSILVVSSALPSKGTDSCRPTSETRERETVYLYHLLCFLLHSSSSDRPLLTLPSLSLPFRFLSSGSFFSSRFPLSLPLAKRFEWKFSSPAQPRLPLSAPP